MSADGYWLISYDRGITFESLLDENGNLVKAIGKDGADGVDGDSLFSEVKVEDGELVLVLKDGTKLRIALKSVEGFTSPVTEISDNYNITYQYKEGVIVLNEKSQRYLVKVEKDSILYFSVNTPANVLPDVGNIISSRITDKAPNGLGNVVVSKTTEGDLIKCETTVASLDDIFEVLELTSSFSLPDLIKDKNGLYDEEGNYYEIAIKNIDEVMANAETRASVGSRNVIEIPLRKPASSGLYSDFSLVLGAIFTFNKSIENNTFECSLEPSIGIVGEFGLKGKPLKADYTSEVAKMLTLIKKTTLFKTNLPIAGGLINLRPFVDFEANLVGKGSVSVGFGRHFSFKCGWTEKGWFNQNTSPEFSLENIFDSFKISGKVGVGPEAIFHLGCGLYTKDLAIMLDAKPSIMLGAELGVSGEKGNNRWQIGGQSVNLDLAVDFTGEIYAKLFNHELYNEEVQLAKVNLLNLRAPIFPEMQNGSLNVVQTNSDPLIFNAQYTITGGIVAKLLDGIPSIRIERDGREIYHMIDAQEVNWVSQATLKYELTDLEKKVTYSAIPCILIGDAYFEWQGIEFSSDEEDEDERLDDVVPENIRDKMGEYIPIYGGVNPPNVEGAYLASPLVTVYCEDGNYSPGTPMSNPMHLQFYNQNSQNNTLDYRSLEGSLSSYSGEGVFISGTGNNFTIFFNSIGVSEGINNRIALVISGTKAEAGIKDLYYAFVMVEKDFDPSGILMAEGVYRVFKDGDGLSVPTSWPSSVRSVSNSRQDYVSPMIRGLYFNKK